MTVVTEADTEMWIMAAGVDAYPWWSDMIPDFTYHDDGMAPDGWTWRVWYIDADTDMRAGRVVIDHTKIIEAIGKIHGDPTGEYSRECWENCHRVMAALNRRDLDDVDFDAATADEVLQVIVHGKVVYG